VLRRGGFDPLVPNSLLNGSERDRVGVNRQFHGDSIEYPKRTELELQEIEMSDEGEIGDW
jgi:hypothetical protein